MSREEEGQDIEGITGYGFIHVFDFILILIGMNPFFFSLSLLISFKIHVGN